MFYSIVHYCAIEPFVYNGFPTQSGKRLQLEMLDIGSRLIDL